MGWLSHTGRLLDSIDTLAAVSPASAPAIPCLADSCSATADCMRFPNVDMLLFTSGPLLLLSSLPGVSLSQQTKQTTHKGHSQLLSQPLGLRSCGTDLVPCSPHLAFFSRMCLPSQSPSLSCPSPGQGMKLICKIIWILICLSTHWTVSSLTRGDLFCCCCFLVILSNTWLKERSDKLNTHFLSGFPG